MNDIFVKTVRNDLTSELKSIGFDFSYIDVAVNKYKGETYKIYNLTPPEANILKQSCLSLGFDCAVNRETITCKCDKTNAILFATTAQLNELTKKLRVQPFRLKKLAEILSDDKKSGNTIIRNINFNTSKYYVAGIVNTTPDSFSDGGKYEDTLNAYKHVLKLIRDGADIIDIGGESTRPGATVIDIETEINRTIPLIEMIRKNGIETPISIDTRNYETAKKAIEAGADIINDVSGLDDAGLFEYVTTNNIPTVIMHSNKVPAESNDFTNCDVVEEIYVSLKNKIDKLTNCGLTRNNIIIDPGIGFGKSKEANFEILKRIEEFKSLKTLILLGISRKSFIRNTFDCDFDEADIVTAMYSSNANAVNIHRVHNVALTKKYLNYMSKLR